jgi:hypothetical protein
MLLFERCGLICFSGVYFTSIDPYNEPKNILKNNYDDAGHVFCSTRLWAKIEWVVEVYIPRNEVEKVLEIKEDVYLYLGDVNLCNYTDQFKIYANPTIIKKRNAEGFF